MLTINAVTLIVVLSQPKAAVDSKNALPPEVASEVACVKAIAQKRGSPLAQIMAGEFELSYGPAVIPGTAMDGADGARALFLRRLGANDGYLTIVCSDSSGTHADLAGWELKRKKGEDWKVVDGLSGFEIFDAVTQFTRTLARSTVRVSEIPTVSADHCHDYF